MRQHLVTSTIHAQSKLTLVRQLFQRLKGHILSPRRVPRRKNVKTKLLFTGLTYAITSCRELPGIKKLNVAFKILFIGKTQSASSVAMKRLAIVSKKPF